jgi:hypothetical protein
MHVDSMGPGANFYGRFTGSSLQTRDSHYIDTAIAICRKSQPCLVRVDSTRSSVDQNEETYKQLATCSCCAMLQHSSCAGHLHPFAA